MFHSNRGIFDIFISISYEKKNKQTTNIALFGLAKQGRFSSAISVFSIKIRFCVYLGSTT